MRPLLALLALALLTVATYATHVQRASFLYEDANAILNPVVQGTAPVAVDRARWLSLLSHKVTYRLSPTPQAAHAVNLALHLASGALVYLLALSLVSPWAAVVAAGLFWLHPLQSEAVAYAASRSELLATTLALCACVWAVRAERWWHHVAVWVCVALAISAKESTVVVVPLLAWLALVRNVELSLWQVAATAVPVIAMAASVFTFDFTRTSELGPLDYAATQSAALWRYLLLIVVPIGQTIDHDFDLVPFAVRAVALFVTAWLTVLFAFVSLSLTDGDTGWRGRLYDRLPHGRMVVFAGVWLLIALAPRFVLRLPENLNEHQFYLPLVGVWMCLGSLVAGDDERVAW